jgi:hypothetical protein
MRRHAHVNARMNGWATTAKKHHVIINSTATNTAHATTARAHVIHTGKAVIVLLLCRAPTTAHRTAYAKKKRVIVSVVFTVQPATSKHAHAHPQHPTCLRVHANLHVAHTACVCRSFTPHSHNRSNATAKTDGVELHAISMWVRAT